MPTVNCFGIHPDEVGLRYLVQDKVSNAYGFSKQEDFHVQTPFEIRKCPHNFRITTNTKGLEHRTAIVASPIPFKEKAYVAHPDEDLDILGAFSNAHIIPAWMLNANAVKFRLFSSNITTLIVPNCNQNQADLINEMQGSLDTYLGKIIFQGDFYFSNKIERLDKLPDGLTVKEAKQYGLVNMSNYLRGKEE